MFISIHRHLHRFPLSPFAPSSAKTPGESKVEGQVVEVEVEVQANAKLVLAQVLLQVSKYSGSWGKRHPLPVASRLHIMLLPDLL